jgi:vancomycin permeability regulator SanA
MRQRSTTPFFRPQRLLRWAIFGIFGIVAAIACANAYVWLSTRGQRFDSEQTVPRARVALVFGAGVRADGRLSRILADRVDAAIALYRSGRVQKLLMSGDNSRPDYDEVTAMRRYAVERGIPSNDITLDYAGFRTYDSCYRARAIFGVEQAVLVTQHYHLPRAVYTCRALGVDAQGFGTPDWQAYPAALIARYSLREAAATAVALWELHITRPLPTFLGPFEGVS